MEKVTECCVCLGPIATKEEKELFKDSKYGFLGNNAEPIKEGRCCTLCDNNFVIPLRMLRLARSMVPKNA